MASPKLFDVLIIGGGPAGLSVATTLARQVYTALVLDSGVYRNAPATHMHTVPGFDHVNPADFRAKARADLQKRYDTVEFKSTTVKQVRKLKDGGFEAMDEVGQVYRGKKLVLGTGVRDVLEDEAPGYADCWGRSIFHCLFCHGFEERGAESAGVLASGILQTPEMLGHIALMAKRLAKHITIYTNGNDSLRIQLKPTLHSTKITYDNRKITKFTHQPPYDSNSDSDNHPASVLITFADGTTKTEGFVASHPRLEQRAALFTTQLGLELEPSVGGSSIIKVSVPSGETSVEGCFAAGDAASRMPGVLLAMQMGMFAASGMVRQLAVDLDAKDEL